MNQTENNNQTQRLLPVSNGRFAMWLFLSTEVMFFAGLFASFIVLRSAVPNGVWPQHEWVHVVFLIGLLNTIILTVSSITAWFALKAKENSNPARSRFLIGVTILLGSMFLAIKVYEYKTKIDLGIRPVAGARQVFDRADIYYLAAVRKDVDQRMKRLESADVSDSRPDEASSLATQTQLDRIYQIRSGLVLWTESLVAASVDPREQQELLDRFARQIYLLDHDQMPALTEELDTEHTELQARLATDQSSYQSVSFQIEQSNQTIKELEDRRRQLEQSVDPQNESNKQQISELNVELSKLKKDVSNQTQQASLQRQAMIPLEKRIEFLHGRTSDNRTNQGGINQTQAPIGLPVVIPGGGTWMNLYYLLTGLHSVHVLVGLLLFLGFFVFGLHKSVSALHNCVLYWHFVDVVWLVMFAVIYF